MSKWRRLVWSLKASSFTSRMVWVLSHSTVSFSSSSRTSISVRSRLTNLPSFTAWDSLTALLRRRYCTLFICLPSDNTSEKHHNVRLRAFPIQRIVGKRRITSNAEGVPPPGCSARFRAPLRYRNTRSAASWCWGLGLVRNLDTRDTAKAIAFNLVQVLPNIYGANGLAVKVN